MRIRTVLSAAVLGITTAFMVAPSALAAGDVYATQSVHNVLSARQPASSTPDGDDPLLDDTGFEEDTLPQDAAPTQRGNSPGGPDYGLLALGGAGVLVVGAGGFLLVRRVRKQG
jgi:hypothetical protein